MWEVKETKQKPPLSRLDLEPVRGLKLEREFRGNLLRWSQVLPKQAHTLIGYNIYRFTKNRFITKRPINRSPITDEFFLDKPGKSKQIWSYLVRPIYKVETFTLEGPSSKIVSEK